MSPLILLLGSITMTMLALSTGEYGRPASAGAIMLAIISLSVQVHNKTGGKL